MEQTLTLPISEETPPCTLRAAGECFRYAASSGGDNGGSLLRTQVVKLLIELGAMHEAKNNEGFTAAEYSYT
jgi:hypothetical protein